MAMSRLLQPRRDAGMNWTMAAVPRIVLVTVTVFIASVMGWGVQDECPPQCRPALWMLLIYHWPDEASVIGSLDTGRLPHGAGRSIVVA
jgi:hypothetical protein